MVSKALWLIRLAFSAFCMIHNHRIHRHCANSGFRREIGENSSLLGYYAPSSGNFLPTFRDNLSVPSSWPLEVLVRSLSTVGFRLWVNLFQVFLGADFEIDLTTEIRRNKKKKVLHDSICQILNISTQSVLRHRRYKCLKNVAVDNLRLSGINLFLGSPDMGHGAAPGAYRSSSSKEFHGVLKCMRFSYTAKWVLYRVTFTRYQQPT
jgi:hypothetical protein